METGCLILDAASLKGYSTKQVEAALADIPGLKNRYVQAARAGFVVAYDDAPTEPETGAVDATSRRETGWLPPAKSFESLIADPRWPRF